MERFLKLLKLIKSFLVEIKTFFTPNEVFFKVVKTYKKDFIKQYYRSLFLKVVNNLKSRSFWLSLFYDKSYDLFSNLLLLLLLMPLFRFLTIILRFFLYFFYSFYYIFINFVFDLIIKYVDVYAKKMRFFYDSSLIEDINEVRRLMLFINVKENFLKCFRPIKDINLDGYIYKEEFINKFTRIFFNVALFFVWHMPLILSFISYIVRFFFVAIWVYLKFFFWYCIVKLVGFFKDKIIWVYIKSKIYKFRGKRFLRKRINTILGLNKKAILFSGKIPVLFINFIKNFYGTIYIWFTIRRKFFINYLKLFFIRKKNIKQKKIRYFFYYKYKRLLYFSKINHFRYKKEFFFLIIFDYIKHIIDDNIIKNLEPFYDSIKDYKNYNEDNWIKKYFVLKIIYYSYKLNVESINNMVYHFIAFFINNFDLKSSKYKYKLNRFKIFILRFKRLLLLIDWELIFPLLIYSRIVIFFFIKYIYLFLLINKYIIICIFRLFVMFLKFILFLLISIFNGRSK